MIRVQAAEVNLSGNLGRRFSIDLPSNVWPCVRELYVLISVVSIVIISSFYVFVKLQFIIAQCHLRIASGIEFIMSNSLIIEGFAVLVFIIGEPIS